MKRYPLAYVEYLAHFHGSRDYFECHELLEAHWKLERDPKRKIIWHGLIQVAVSAYHERRGNYQGAVKMMEQAVSRLSPYDSAASDESDLLTTEQPSGSGPESITAERLVQVARFSGLDPLALGAILRIRLKLLKDAAGGKPLTFVDIELPIADGKLLDQSKKLCEAWGCTWGRPSPAGDEDLVHRHLRRDRTEVVEERQRQLAARRNGIAPTEREMT